MSARRGAAVVASLLVVAAAAAVVFAVAIALDAPAWPIGGSLALAFAALAAAATVAARTIVPRRVVVDPAEPGPSGDDVRDDAESALVHALPRRHWLERVALGAAGVVGVALLAPLITLVPRTLAAAHPSFGGRRLVDPDGRPLRPDDLARGGIATVFPEGSAGDPNAAAVLINVGDALELPPERAGWAARGCVAYSKVCTHAGCAVALYADDTHTLMCPCHQSRFDAARGAAVTGGPAGRALPQLPLTVDADGYVRAAGDFSGPVGPDRWDRTVT